MTNAPTPEAMAATHAAAFAPSRPWRAEEFSDLLATPGCFATGDAACFALVRAIAGEAELLTIATHPEHRRQGRARACMGAWLAEAMSRGASRAFLEVAADNPAARALYRAMGFAETGRRPGYYPRPGRPAVDAVIMSCALPQGQRTET
ncbi:MAG: GNAT family N-acetyltransferase [Antarcticimicrobium sp.]|uniref:GNAT family N-acetyltransferase n=1 Tax=Antarcticimicrobium sp. TaxID=2824147 RepID=UPI002615C400|nr:GNAT family N-acetyltransferase [Antarcticimicrobium sp.]MDF1717672.1 GNAT family N-acetyltransferase [Antarcticimicrobium sp.]